MISIIIPVKNHPIVERLLSKLCKPNFNKDTEIIIVDASEGKLKNVQNKFPKVKWLNYKSSSKNSVAEQRNYGIKKSKGDIIAFIDADCVPTDTWLKNLVKPLENNNEKIVSGYIISERKYPRKWEDDYKKSSKQKYVDFARTMNSAFKKEVFDKVGLYDPTFTYGGEDSDLCFRAIKAGYKIRFVESAVIYHDWGTINRNLSRIYLYGRANFYFFIKHFKQFSLSYIYGVLIFTFFLLFLPVAYWFPYYLLLILIPFIRNFIEFKSVENALEHIIFGLINALGFITECINYSIKRLRLLT